MFREYPGAPDNPGQIHYPLSVYPLSVLTPESKPDSKRQKRKKCLFLHEKRTFFALFSTISAIFRPFFQKEIASSHASLSRPKITIRNKLNVIPPSGAHLVHVTPLRHVVGAAAALPRLLRALG